MKAIPAKSNTPHLVQLIKNSRQTQFSEIIFCLHACLGTTIMVARDWTQSATHSVIY